MSDLSESVNMPATPITIHPIVGIMPRPGQPGALRFDGTGISDFLKDWELECEEYGPTVLKILTRTASINLRYRLLLYTALFIINFLCNIARIFQHLLTELS